MTTPLSYEHPHFGKVDLDNCENEPIHTPGAVQPHGVLLVFSEPDLILRQVSTSSDSVLGIAASSLVGKPLTDLLTGPTVEVVREALEADNLAEVNPLRIVIGEIDLEGVEACAAGGGVYDGILHRSGGRAILELEPSGHDLPEFAHVYRRVRRSVARLRATHSVHTMCEVAAREVRHMTGFDRVMIYRFDPDWHGEVIAEARREDLQELLGIHYPAADIPAQARRLYELNWIRLIADVGYEPAPLYPLVDPKVRAPLDLSFAVLRSVSPMHLAYLRNMGVGASMSISLIVEGKLWGLIACHHYSPRFVPYETRMASEFLGQVLSWQVAARERGEVYENTAAARNVQLHLVDNVVGQPRPVLALAGNPRSLLSLVGAEGAALYEDGELELVGRTPEADFVRELIFWLGAREEGEGEEPFHTFRLPERHPAGQEHQAVASGLLAVAVTETAWILWFRPEVRETVHWGSNPDKRAMFGLQGAEMHIGPRLTPEGSFELWKETVSGQAVRWEPWEVATAKQIGLSLRGLMARRATELAQVNEELRAVSHAKDEFLALLSHELRTPLNAILGWTALLGRGLDPERRTRAVEVIDRNARLQAQLVDDLLDISRIIGGKLRLDVRTIRLDEVIERAIDSVQTAAEAKEIRLDKICDPGAGPVLGDPDRLQQVIWNLLTNAIKFTPKRGRVQVRLERDQSSVLVEVADSGVGIQEELLPHIFERFRQADGGYTRTSTGLGLGLSIVKSLVELHGGVVDALSEGTGAGSTFRVRLPLSPVRAEPLVHPTAEPDGDKSLPWQSLEGVRILLVEDEADAREVLVSLLEGVNAEVTAVASAREALDYLDASKPDVLVSDIGMPGMDGYELLRTLRRRRVADGGRIPAVALTAYARSQDRTQAFAAGFQAHVPKPVDPAELMSAVASLAGKRFAAS